MAQKYKVVRQHLILLEKALDLLEKFFDGDPVLLLNAVGEAYSVPKENAEIAANLFMETGLDRKNEKMAAVCREMVELLPDEKEQEEYVISIPVEIHNDIQKVLDLYCRMMLGQFSAAYDFLLDAGADDYVSAVNSFFVADFRWSAPSSFVEARNTLVPGCKGIGWNGNLGISNVKACEDAKLAYEMAKVMDQPNHIKLFSQSDAILRVSGFPLMEEIL